MSASRNPWPWAISIFMACFALGTVAFVVWSLRHQQDLVAPDYYERELQHQAQIDSSARARKLGASHIRFDTAQKALVIQPIGGATAAHLSLYRAADARLDQSYALGALTEEPVQFPTDSLAKGPWRAILDWEQQSQTYRMQIVFVN